MRMARSVLILGCLSTILLVSGCFGSSFGRTADERAHMYKTILRSEWQMAKDDIDVWNMVERRTRLTRWH